MAKIYIKFNNKNYSIDESSFATASAELKQHLSTTMSGSGSTITFDGVSYNIGSAKLATATNNFISHLSKIVGTGSKVIVGGIEYPFESNKTHGAFSELEAVLGNLNDPDEEVDIVIVLDEAILDEHVLG